MPIFHAAAAPRLGSFRPLAALLAAVWFLLSFPLLTACDNGGSSHTDKNKGDGDGDNDGGGGKVKVTLKEVFTQLSLESPMGMFQAPGMEDRWFAIERAGRVVTFADDSNADSLDEAVDITGIVNEEGEGGLLGLTFHPDFAESGADGEHILYLSYTRNPDTGALTSVISEFTYDPESETIDAGSENEQLTLEQPYTNHNGGNIAFGADGYLYIGFGDGGSGGDPDGNGQNTDTLLGKMLRIEVNPSTAYDIPPDNPFAGGGGLPEIWAWGFRNPWRWSFDRETGGLWVGDVGQDAWEEVDRVEGGKNYGWNVMEGGHCYGSDTCDDDGLTAPVAEYSHDDGCSIIGGYVSRRDPDEALYGQYLFSDYCSGTLWALARPDASDPDMKKLLNANLNPVSFTESAVGVLYLIDQSGRILRIDEK